MSWILISLDDALPDNERKSVGDAVRRVADVGLDASSHLFRTFDRLNALGVLSPSVETADLEAIHGVTLARFGGVTATSEDGSWYLRLATAWEHVLEEASKLNGGALNMSLTPPSLVALPVHKDELVRRATARAWRLGIVPVLAAGNWSRYGMSPWTQSQFCISVGAADVFGRKISAFSSRGVAGSSSGPTVVGPEEQIPPTGEVGTSFAAPVVTDVAIYFVAFLRQLWIGAGREAEEFTRVCCDAVAALVRASAREIEGPPHARGNGFVDVPTALGWLQGLSASSFRSVAPQFEFVDDQLFTAAKRDAGHYDALIEANAIGRFTIDEEFDWIKPVFVPGLYPSGDSLVFRQVSEVHTQEDIDWVLTPVGQARFVEITIRPQHLRGTPRRVGSGPGEYSSFEGALAESNPGDIVWLPSGQHVGPFNLKSGITIQGEPGTVFTAFDGPVVRGNRVSGVSMRGLSVAAIADRASAVDLRGSSDIGIQDCDISSVSGNAVTALMCRRIFFDSCRLTAGLNGGFFGLGQELRWQSCEIESSRAGLVLHGGAGWMYQTRISAGTDAVSFFGFDFPWRFEEDVTVFLYPFSKEVLKTRDVRLKSVLTNGPGAWLARLLFGLQIVECTLVGERAALLANDFRFVTVTGGSRRGLWSDVAEINASLTDDSRAGKDPIDLLNVVAQLLSGVELKAVSSEVLNR